MNNHAADGAAGARRAAALLTIAVCGETAHTTLSEDAAKVDLKISFRHAFLSAKLLTIHIQVKSGFSYRSGHKDSTKIKLKIDAATRDALQGSGQPGLIVWVPPWPRSRLYWYAVDPRRPPPNSILIDNSMFIRPSLRYDLTRLLDYSAWGRSSPSQMMSGIDDAEVLAQAKVAYSELRTAKLHHPLVGRVAITRLAWRHVTRHGKRTGERIRTLLATPYLKAFLDKMPSRYVCNPDAPKIVGKRLCDKREILCWYRGALKYQGEKFSLLIRFVEEIYYPANWLDRPLGISDVQQKTTLASWWFKKDT